jgi:hypothetical protein
MMIAFFMYGGMLMSIFPQQENISFEYHFFGAVSGVLAAILFRNLDPKLQEKRYSWENEEDEENEEKDEFQSEISEYWKQHQNLLHNDINNDTRHEDPIGEEWRSDENIYKAPYGLTDNGISISFEPTALGQNALEQTASEKSHQIIEIKPDKEESNSKS